MAASDRIAKVVRDHDLDGRLQATLDENPGENRLGSSNRNRVG